MQENHSVVFHQPHRQPSWIVNDSVPADFIPLKQWHAEFGYPVFSSAKMLDYFTHPLRRELIEAGVMAKTGQSIYLHKTRFWAEYQRIVAANLEGGCHGQR